MIYHVAICDDNEEDIWYLHLLVQKWVQCTGHTAQIQTFSTAESFLFQYSENKMFDILLLDIEMGDMNGIELAKAVRLQQDSVQIVFITGFPDFMAEGYEVAALHYLIKPVQEDKLYQVLDRAVQNLQKNERNILFSVSGEILRVPVGEILCVEAFAHTTMVTTVQRRFEVSVGISKMEKQLGSGFVRCHRSYLAGLQHIKRITKTSVVLDTNQELPLSKSHYAAVNQAFIAYFRGEEHGFI